MVQVSLGDEAPVHLVSRFCPLNHEVARRAQLVRNGREQVVGRQAMGCSHRPLQGPDSSGLACVEGMVSSSTSEMSGVNSPHTQVSVAYSRSEVYISR